VKLVLICQYFWRARGEMLRLGVQAQTLRGGRHDCIAPYRKDQIQRGLKLCSHLEALSQQLHNIVECRSGIKLAFNRTKAYRVTETYAQATNRIYNITQTADIYSRPPTLLS
jgi:hypothetical protein